ncbi:hypothetical protein XENTR_v10006578 [Xenopus tropicalis]|nr:hypothetical protein XENTR_v10006578 [Xenopus tropicalis]
MATAECYYYGCYTENENTTYRDFYNQQQVIKIKLITEKTLKPIIFFRQQRNKSYCFKTKELPCKVETIEYGVFNPVLVPTEKLFK